MVVELTICLKILSSCITRLNVVLPTLFAILSTTVNNIVESESGVPMLNNIVDQSEQCGQHNIIQSCFQQYCIKLMVFRHVHNTPSWKALRKELGSWVSFELNVILVSDSGLLLLLGEGEWIGKHGQWKKWGLKGHGDEFDQQNTSVYILVVTVVGIKQQIPA